MNDTIIVMTGNDSHLSRVQRLLPQMRELWNDDVDFGVANFAATNDEDLYRTNVWPSKRFPIPSAETPVKLLEFAKDNGIHSYVAPRQEFIPAGREQHCCEVLGFLAISKYFYDVGFESVCLLHTDIRIERDFLPFLNSLKTGNWSFIAPEVLENRNEAANEPLRVKGRDDYAYWRKKMIANISDIRLTQEQPSRATNECLIFNKAFVRKTYETYGTVKNMWDEVFCELPMWGDVGLYGISRNFLGFNAVFIERFLVHGVNLEP